MRVSYLTFVAHAVEVVTSWIGPVNVADFTTAIAVGLSHGFGVRRRRRTGNYQPRPDRIRLSLQQSVGQIHSAQNCFNGT